MTCILQVAYGHSGTGTWANPQHPLSLPLSSRRFATGRAGRSRGVGAVGTLAGPNAAFVDGHLRGSRTQGATAESPGAQRMGPAGPRRAWHVASPRPWLLSGGDCRRWVPLLPGDRPRAPRHGIMAHIHWGPSHARRESASISTRNRCAVAGSTWSNRSGGVTRTKTPQTSRDSVRHAPSVSGYR